MNIRFKNTSIKVSQRVYEPSEDSFLLAEAALCQIHGREKVLELGCGSGIISAVIKANTRAEITGIDINPFAVKCSKENGIDVIRGDLLSCIKGKFDMILFNPPYLPTGDEERTPGWLNDALDGGPDGRSMIFRFLKDAGRCLTENGRILLLVSSLTGIEEVKAGMNSLGYSLERIACERFDFEQLTVLAASRS